MCTSSYNKNGTIGSIAGSWYRSKHLNLAFLACYSSYSLSTTGRLPVSQMLREPPVHFVALSSPSLRGALRYHWCPIAFIVMAGSTTTSSIEYNRAKDGIAMNIGMILGKMVRIISIVVPWTILCGIGFFFSWKCHKARTNIHDTKTKIRMRKKKISWCKSMIPCIIGVAASWDPNCHGSAASQGAIVRNGHEFEWTIIGIFLLWPLCSHQGDLKILGLGFSKKRIDWHAMPMIFDSLKGRLNTHPIAISHRQTWQLWNLREGLGEERKDSRDKKDRSSSLLIRKKCEVDLKSFSSAQWEEEFSCREKAKSTIYFILVINEVVRKPYSEVQCDRSMTQGKHLSPSFRVHSSFPNGLIRMMLELVLCLLPTVSYSSFSTTLLFQTCMV